MQFPGGLSIDNNNLFICDGRAGLKVFDTSDPQDLQKRPGLPEVRCNDVIAQDNLLYVISDSTIEQYDYTSLPPRLVSNIKAAANI